MKRIKRHIGIHHINTWKSFVLVMAIITGGVLGIAYSIQAYPEVFKTEVSVEKKADIGPSEPVLINFSSPVLADNYISKVKINPIEGFDFKFNQSNTQLAIIPKNFWKPESDYTIFLPEAKNAILGKVESSQVNFSTTSFPKIKKIYPSDGARDILLDIEDPIVVDFDKSTKDFFIKFVVSPQSNMTYENNPEKTQFKLLPKDKTKDGETYNLEIWIKARDDSDNGYKKISQTSFITSPPPIINWEKDFTLRLEQARKYTRPRITSGKYIDINLATQIMSTFENGKLLDSYLISSGKRGMETPKGDHKIYNKSPRVWSKAYGLYMPYWMAIMGDGSRGIHELPEWPGGYKEGANHLGIPVSHGCVRLGVGPAKAVYDWADIGTPVIVY